MLRPPGTHLFLPIQGMYLLILREEFIVQETGKLYCISLCDASLLLSGSRLPGEGSYTVTLSWQPSGHGVLLLRVLLWIPGNKYYLLSCYVIALRAVKLMSVGYNGKGQATAVVRGALSQASLWGAQVALVGTMFTAQTPGLSYRAALQHIAGRVTGMQYRSGDHSTGFTFVYCCALLRQYDLFLCTQSGTKNVQPLRLVFMMSFACFMLHKASPGEDKKVLCHD